MTDSQESLIEQSELCLEECSIISNESSQCFDHKQKRNLDENSLLLCSETSNLDVAVVHASAISHSR